jgi:hypothetical protein
VNRSFSGEENLSYVFEEGNIMKMYYAGQEIETIEPIVYTIKEDGDYYILEASYKKKSNGFSSDLLGILTFTGKNQMDLEFFDKKKLPEDLDFTEEVLSFTREGKPSKKKK